jgi:hypothetical protein
MATPAMKKTYQVALQAHNLKTYDERYAAGKAFRAACPRKAHAGWKAPANRPDSVELVLASEMGRIPDLLPQRHGRMVRSAFTCYTALDRAVRAGKVKAVFEEEKRK